MQELQPANGVVFQPGNELNLMTKGQPVAKYRLRLEVLAEDGSVESSATTEHDAARLLCVALRQWERLIRDRRSPEAAIGFLLHKALNT